MLILHSGLCKMCPHRAWYPSCESLYDKHFHWAGWHWCPKRGDYIHDSLGCTEREIELKPKRIPLAVRLGLKPNEQGEYLA